MNTKHTRGPWKYDKQKSMIIAKELGEDTETIMVVNLLGAMGSYDVEADAQLIAAAPDLLELLQWAVNEIESTPDELSDALLGLIKIKARKAIEKATQI